MAEIILCSLNKSLEKQKIEDEFLWNERSFEPLLFPFYTSEDESVSELWIFTWKNWLDLQKCGHVISSFSFPLFLPSSLSLIHS